MATPITNVTELQAMVDGVDYELTNDIDASATSGLNWNAGRGVYEGFAPIAYYSNTFDGKGFKVTNLHIDRDATGVALFSYIDGATIQNVTLENCSISTDRGQIATLAYYIHSFAGPCTISNCHSSGSVSALDSFWGRQIGGLLGAFYNDGGDRHSVIGCSSSCNVATARGYAGGLTYTAYHVDVSNSFATGGVTSGNSDQTGGFVGIAQTATIERCYALGEVDASPSSGWAAGGFAGAAYDVIIRNSYARGAVTGYQGIGGFVGDMDITAVDDTIGNCFSTGLVTAHSYYGGFSGYDYDNGGTSNSFWDTQTSGQATSVGGTGLTTAEMKAIASFSAWDIAPHTLNLNNGYPYLAWQAGTAGVWLIVEEAPIRGENTIDIIALEAMRNIEMSAMGRIYVDEEGNLCYESRYARSR